MKRALIAAIATAGMLAVAAPAGAAVAHHGHDSPTRQVRPASTEHSKPHGAQQGRQVDGTPPVTVSSTDRHTSISSRDTAFLVTAASGALTEIEAGQLAVSQGTSDAVKAYGQRLVTDHTRELAKLRWIAGATGVTLPTSPDAAQQGEVSTLGSTDSTSFDRAFLTAAVADHRSAVKAFSKEARSARRGVARFARMELPMLEKHLRIAEFDLWCSHIASMPTTTPTASA